MARLELLDFLTAADLPTPSLRAPRDRTLVDRAPAWKLWARLFRPRLEDRSALVAEPLSRLRSLPPLPAVDSTTDTFFSPDRFLISLKLVERDLASDLPARLLSDFRRSADVPRALTAAGVTDLLLLPPAPPAPSASRALSRLRLLDMDLLLSTVSVLGTPVDDSSTPCIAFRPAERLRGGS